MSIYRITTRDAEGQDSTVRLEAAKAEYDGPALRLTKADGSLVGSFISVIALIDESAEDQG